MTSSEKYSEAPINNNDLSCDKIFSNDISILQKKNGYRFNSDSMVLSWFIYNSVKGKKLKRALEIGSGTGIIPIVLIKRGLRTPIDCIEIQESLFNVLEINIKNNCLTEYLFPQRYDFRNFADITEKKYDLIFTNPPYFGINDGKISEKMEKAVAKHEFFGSVSDFINLSEKLLIPGGHFIFIYPLSRIQNAFFSLKKHFALKEMFLIRENPVSAPSSMCVHLIFKGENKVARTDLITIRDESGNYSKTGIEIMYDNFNIEK